MDSVKQFISEWFSAEKLPFATAEAVSGLLAAAGDPELSALAESISREHRFSLTSSADRTCDVFETLPRHDLRIRKRQPVSPLEYKQINLDSIASWFSSNGEFAQCMPGYEPRPQQLEMAAAVAAAFSSQKHLAVEAGTGTGKTMAYLVPAVIWTLANKVPVVISTNTKNLQEQIFNKDLPFIRNIINTPFSAAIIKGRSNYVCLKKVLQIIDAPEDHILPSQALSFALICAWIHRTAAGDMSELPCMPSNEFLQMPSDQVCSSPEECRGRKCGFYSRCFLQHARAQSLNADVVITNHAVYFSEPDGTAVALPEHAQVIFDEAHNLEEAATLKFKADFSEKQFKQVLSKLYRKTSRREIGLLPNIIRITESLPGLEDNELPVKIGDIIKCTETADKLCSEFLQHFVLVIPVKETSFRLKKNILEQFVWKESVEPHLFRLQDAFYELVENIEHLKGLLKKDSDELSAIVRGEIQRPQEMSFDPEDAYKRVSGAYDELETLCASINELYGTLTELTAFDNKDRVYWANVKRGRKGKSIAELHSAPIHLGNFLAKNVYDRKDSVVFCSATLSTNGNMDFISDRIGLDLIEPDRLMRICEGSPFDYAGQCLAAVPGFLPDISFTNDENENFQTQFSDFLIKASEVCSGRMLVLFTSYSSMTRCAEISEPALKELGIRLLIQGAGASRETITREFRESQPAVLFGTDSFWEGVDIIGDTLSCVVMSKLPFDAVGDPVLGARADEVKERTGDAFRNFSLPNAIIKFRQGFGRLIRHKNDRGTVIIADKRIFGKNYGIIFRKSIPAEITAYKNCEALLKDIHSFLRSKPPAIII